MKLISGILIPYCCLLACSLVSGENTQVVANENDNTTKDTPQTSDNAKTTSTPNQEAATFNVPPKSNENLNEKVLPLVKLLQGYEDNAKKDSNQKMTSESEKVGMLKMGTDEVKMKPVLVTGFITKTGSIYEIQDKQGIGMIESRQNRDLEGMHVCNRGNIVIYSDVPCDQVTNVYVSDIVHISADQLNKIQNQTQTNTQQEEQQPTNEQQSDEHINDVEMNVEDIKPPRRRNGQKRKRAPQQNQIRRRTNKNNNKTRQQISSSSNRTQQKRRRGQPTSQKLRKQQQKRRRLQNQQQPSYSSVQRRKQKNTTKNQRKRREHGRGSTVRRGDNVHHLNRLQNQRRRLQQNGRRRYIDENDY